MSEGFPDTLFVLLILSWPLFSPTPRAIPLLTPFFFPPAQLTSTLLSSPAWSLPTSLSPLPLPPWASPSPLRSCSTPFSLSICLSVSLSNTPLCLSVCLSVGLPLDSSPPLPPAESPGWGCALGDCGVLGAPGRQGGGAGPRGLVVVVCCAPPTFSQ